MTQCYGKGEYAKRTVQQKDLSSNVSDANPGLLKRQNEWDVVVF